MSNKIRTIYYSVYDKKAQLFSELMAFDSPSSALRSLDFLLNKDKTHPDNPKVAYPEDFVLVPVVVIGSDGLIYTADKAYRTLEDDSIKSYEFSLVKTTEGK